MFYLIFIFFKSRDYVLRKLLREEGPGMRDPSSRAAGMQECSTFYCSLSRFLMEARAFRGCRGLHFPGRE